MIMILPLKKILFVLMSLALSHGAVGQTPLDTLYANQYQHVALFFPETIERAVTGHGNFVFTYNREKAEHLGLLQAVPGTTSNLLVITSDARVYAYILEYAEELPEHNHFIRPEESIGRNRPMQKAHTAPPMDVHKNLPWRKVCDRLLRQRHPGIKTKRKKGLRFRLEHLAHRGPEVYLIFAVQNRSGIDFDMGHLDILHEKGSQKRRAAHQQIPLVPLYIHGEPSKIKTGTTARFVYVLPKFTLGDHERILFQLKEMGGGRNLTIKFR